MMKTLLDRARRLLVLSFVPLLIVLLFCTFDSRSRVSPPTSTNLAAPLDFPFWDGCATSSKVKKRADAVMLMLCRNSDLREVLETLESVENAFNKQFKYPYVMLNDVPFNKTFKKSVSKAVRKVSFHTVSEDMWSYPEFIDKGKARAAMRELKAQDALYGGNESYHHMCRFYSGMFYKHEALKPFSWYWRLEPGVQYFCKLSYDPFLAMQRNNKVYGFTMSLWELGETVHSLFWKLSEHYSIDPTTNPLMGAFIDRKYPASLAWILTHVFGGDGYASNGYKWNMCHFWSNFEIASLDWYRGPEYERFFNTVDRLGGLYYERWGDASIHALAAALLLRPEQLHFFEDIGYRHDELFRCPPNVTRGVVGGCNCNCTSNVPNATAIPEDCIDLYKAVVNWPKANTTGSNTAQ